MGNSFREIETNRVCPDAGLHTLPQEAQVKKKKPPKERNFLVPVMRLNFKPGPHKDKRKEAARVACRVKLRPGLDFFPAFA